MTLVRIRHFYDNGIGHNKGDVWSVVETLYQGEEWNESRARKYVKGQNAVVYVLEHNEYERPTFFYLDEPFPEWSDGGWYDYDECESRNESDATCDAGCHICPHHDTSFYRLQNAQQIAWIKEHGKEIKYER
ncbi:MAG: hypothetical protein FWH12_02285 [Treponema sp.]|nr:hypothetical protein [Treponema sp.]